MSDICRCVRALALLCAVLLFASACTVNRDDIVLITPLGEPAPTPVAERTFLVGHIDAALTRNDVRCLDGLPPIAPTAEVTVVHYVVNGNLGAVCTGIADPRVLQAWNLLVSITPPDQLRSLGTFAGFTMPDTREHRVYNGYATVYNDYTAPRISVNLSGVSKFGAAMQTTMAHEMSHIFTQLPDQRKNTVPKENCPTFHDGIGCYYHESFMHDWILRFWSGPELDSYDPSIRPTQAIGAARCRANGGFIGPYAASTPFEDFAVSYAAFVLRRAPENDAQRQKMEWFAARPALVEGRDLAIQSGYGPVENYGGGCGEGSAS